MREENVEYLTLYYYFRIQSTENQHLALCEQLEQAFGGIEAFREFCRSYGLKFGTEHCATPKLLGTEADYPGNLILKTFGHWTTAFRS